MKSYLGSLESLIVAFSGGVDSGLLLKVACEVLGERVLAVTSDSPALPRMELSESKRVANGMGARHLVIPTYETKNEDYIRNPLNRCYFCKFELYSTLFQIAKREHIKHIANGTNLDDLGDYRPGLQAASEFKVISPLKDAGLSKNEVRFLARHLGLDICDKPATPCLASRIPYGIRVTPEKLAMIEKAEQFLKELEVKELRVRHFGKLARIETNASDFPVIHENMDLISSRFKEIGFDDIQINEFRSGALNPSA